MTEHSRAWLQEEIVNVDVEIRTLSARYRVPTPDELEQAIRIGAVEGHPAWEDCLGWQNLLNYRASLVAELTSAG